MKLRSVVIVLLLSCARIRAAAPHAVPSSAPTHPGAAPGVACTFDAMTDRCKVFDPAKVGPRIPVTADTAIPNFAALRNAREKRPLHEAEKFNKKKSSRMKKQQLEAKAKIWQVLSEIPDSKMSLKFKMGLLSTDGPEDIFEGYLLHDLFDRTKDENRKLSLFWPPGDASAEVKEVTLKDARATLIPLFGDKKERLQAAVAQLDKREDMIWDDSQSDDEKKILSVTPERRRAVSLLIEKAKHYLVETIRAGRPLGALSEQERNAIHKVETVQWRPPEDKLVRGHIACAGFIPNAWYDPEDHTMNVCPGFFNFPDATIMGVLGHELTHSLDPCNGQFGFYQVDKTALDKLKNEVEHPTPELEKTLKLSGARYIFGLLQQVYDHRVSDKVYTAFPFGLMSSPEALDFYVKRGILKREAPDVLPKDYLLKDTYACLRTPEGGGFYSPSPQEVREMAEKVVDHRARELVGEKARAFNRQNEIERIVQAFGRHPDCIGSNGKHSQMGEAMADWAGAEVLGKYLAEEKAKGNAPDTREKRLASIGFFASLVCMEHYAPKREKESDGDIIDQTRRAEMEIQDAHPGSKDRIDNIFIRNAGVRSALGCDPSPKQACTHQPATRAVAATR